MTKAMTIEREFHVRRGQRNRRHIRECKKTSPSANRVPRVARLVALAIRFEQLLRDGIVADQAQLAQLGRESRARLTQIMNLLNLAPDIQDELLGWRSLGPRRGRLSERSIRPIVAEVDWQKQRQIWLRLKPD